MSVGLLELENGVILVRDRLVHSDRSIGPRKSSYGFWGSTVIFPAGSRAEPLQKWNIWNTA